MSYDFSGEPVVLPSVAVSGLPGATAGARFVGGTPSGPPVSGTFVVGDYSIDQTGGFWTCVTAGSPGIWLPGGSGVELASAELVSDSNTFGNNVTSDITGLSITFVAPSRPFLVELTVPGPMVVGTAATSGTVQIADAANVALIYMSAIAITGNNAPAIPGPLRVRLPRTGGAFAYPITPGNSYTFKVRGYYNSGAATAYLYTNTGELRPILRAVTC